MLCKTNPRPHFACTRLFEKFEPGERAEAGSGLGFAFCRLAITASGGRIWFEPAQDEAGATFAFTLPVAPAPVGAPPVRAS